MPEQGIKIEFDTEKVAAAVLQHYEIENGAPLAERSIWSKVEYAKTFATIAAADVFAFLKQEKDLELRRIKERVETNLDIYYKRMSIIKSDGWSSENEWRLMWRDNSAPPSVYKCPIFDECIRNIFIGLNFKGDASAYAGEAKHQFPNAGVFQAIKRHGGLVLAGIRRIPGDFEAKIALLTCLSNGISPRHRQQAIEARG